VNEVKVEERDMQELERKWRKLVLEDCWLGGLKEVDRFPPLDAWQKAASRKAHAISSNSLSSISTSTPKGAIHESDA
jgi:hypothetical protein